MIPLAAKRAIVEGQAHSNSERARFPRSDTEIPLQEQHGQEDEEKNADDDIERTGIGVHENAGSDQGSGETRGRQNRYIPPHDLPGEPEPEEGSERRAKTGEPIGSDGHLGWKP
jgi:hypothetical protein